MKNEGDSMKVKTINRLRNVGILDEDAYINEFSLYKTEEKNGEIKTIYTSKALIRGDNGTGKSTLSNIFRSIEEKDKTNEIISNIKNIEKDDNIDIEIELDNGTLLKYDNIQQKWVNDEQVLIKVFNEDYIRENINLEEFEQNKINGKYETKNIEISIEKKEYEESNKKVNRIIEEGKAISKELINTINNTNNKIKEELDRHCLVDTNLENYNETEDEKIYEEKQLELKSSINAFKKLRNADTFNILKLNSFVNNINNEELINLLNYSEDNAKIDFMNQFLKLSLERKKWMDVGMSYIENDKCPFCKNDISKNDFINQYKKYRESNNKEVEEKLNKYKIELERICNDVEKDIKISISKNKEYAEIVNIKEEISDEDWERFSSDFKYLIEIIDEKLIDVSKQLKQELLEIFKEKLGVIQIIADKSKSIDEETKNINNKMINAKKELTNLRSKIRILHKDILEYTMRESIAKRKKLLNDLTEEQKQNKVKKEKYDKKVEDADITIKEMNKWLEFFGMKKYKVNKNFNLIYKDNDISNKMFILSTGEISALVFSYYLSSLITGLTNEEKSKLIIVIDDPVNSLDYNKIYSFATAIKIIQKKVSESSTPQLIILTHNMLFFNILVQTSWMKSKNAKVFELYKEQELSKIKETKNYKDSLFVLQLSEIIKYANQNIENISIEKSYIYNDIRSVIENLCYLLNPKYVDNDDKYSVLKELFDIQEEEFMKLDYIINNNSHNEPMLNIEKWFDPTILYEACVVISNMIHTRFNDLYNYCSSFSGNETKRD